MDNNNLNYLYFEKKNIVTSKLNNSMSLSYEYSYVEHEEAFG